MENNSHLLSQLFHTPGSFNQSQNGDFIRTSTILKPADPISLELRGNTMIIDSDAVSLTLRRNGTLYRITVDTPGGTTIDGVRVPFRKV